MSEVILYGIPQSTYVRTAIMTCAEKGAQHKLVVQRPHSPEQRELHPFGKVPAMKHGDVQLYETSAICRYIDQTFDGPALIPASAAEAGLMEQWVSVSNSYLYPSMIDKYALLYLIPMLQGTEPDRAAIEAGVAKMTSSMEMLDKSYDGRDFLVGDSLTLADLFVMPIVQTMSMLAESKKALDGCANLKRAFETMSARKSFAAAHPKQG